MTANKELGWSEQQNRGDLPSYGGKHHGKQLYKLKKPQE